MNTEAVIGWRTDYKIRNSCVTGQQLVCSQQNDPFSSSALTQNSEVTTISSTARRVTPAGQTGNVQVKEEEEGGDKEEEAETKKCAF